MERRKLFLGGPVEVREAEGRPATLCGRAVVYNSWSEMIYGQFQERILPEAFKDHLRTNPDVLCTIDHDESRLLGRTSSGQLKLVDGPDGIDVECPAPDTTYARDLTVLMRRGDVRGMSFTFDVDDDTWGRTEGRNSRDVRKGRIHEVAFVIRPAYPTTQCGLRGVEGSDAEKAALLTRAYEATTAWKHKLMRRELALHREMRGYKVGDEVYIRWIEQDGDGLAKSEGGGHMGKVVDVSGNIIQVKADDGRTYKLNAKWADPA